MSTTQQDQVFGRDDFDALSVMTAALEECVEMELSPEMRGALVGVARDLTINRAARRLAESSQTNA